MKFNNWSMERIKQGRKHITSRTKAYNDDTAVKSIVGPLPWGFIRDYLYRDEGADSPEELQRVINQIFRHEVKDDRLFYVHVLKGLNDLIDEIPKDNTIKQTNLKNILTDNTK